MILHQFGACTSVQAPVVFKVHIMLLLLKLHLEMGYSIMSNNEINVLEEAAA
jgi:hypothetical protein